MGLSIASILNVEYPMELVLKYFEVFGVFQPQSDITLHEVNTLPHAYHRYTNKNKGCVCSLKKEQALNTCEYPKEICNIPYLEIVTNCASLILTLQNAIEMTGGAINIPLKDGKSINIPVDRITYDPESGQVSLFSLKSVDFDIGLCHLKRMG